MLPIQNSEHDVLGLIWPFDYAILVYNMWVREADVINPLYPAFFHLHPTQFKTK